MKRRYVYICIILSLSYLCNQAYCQTNKNLYSEAIAINNAKIAGKEKLALLYSLKKKAEKANLTNDSGYTITLIKIANNECDFNNNLALAAELTSLALKKLSNSSNIQSENLVLNSCYNLATYYYKMMLYDKATHYYDTVISISKKHDPDNYLLIARYYTTAISDLLGDYQKTINQSTIGINESVSKKDTFFHICFLYFSARSLMLQNQLQQAQDSINRLIAMAQNPVYAYELANAYNVKAAVYTEQKNFQQAVNFYQLALVTRPYNQNENKAVAHDYNDLGIFYHTCLKDYKKAEENFNKAIEYGMKCSPEQRSMVLLMEYGNLGNVLADKNLPFKAIAYYTKALHSVNIEVPDFFHSNPSLKQLSSIGEKELILSIFFSKCNFLLKLYKAGNDNSYLQNSIETAILTDSLITQMRHEQLGEKSKLYWRNETHKFFADAMEACYFSGNVEKAFFFMEKSRSVLLSDKLNELSSTVTYLPVQVVAKETNLKKEVVSLQKQLSLLLPSSKEYSNFQNKFLEKEEDLNTYIKFLEKKYPLYYQFKYADSIPPLSSLQDYLNKNNQSFVYYFMNDTAIYALSISKNKTSFIKIPASDFDSRQLADFINLCSNKQAINSNYSEFASLSQTIYNKLFKPLQLPKGNVAICTDNFFIPFEALCTDVKGENFLLYDYNFSYVYSARSLIKPFTCGKASGNFAGFAPVSFSPALTVFDLKNSATALDDVANFYSNSTLFTEQQATRSNFFNQASKYSVVTIFSHAQADTTDKEPVLYMHDSLIHLSELQMLRNPCIQFVLLSACQTNIGKNAAGEGIYSLARGFAAAGVPSVSATLWKADEATVYQISVKFNEHLSAGMDKSEALQKAKVWYLQNCDKEHTLPYYWANMVLIGSSQPISLAGPNHSWLWISIIILLIATSSFYFIYRKRKRNSLYARLN